jgi:hypothetical protein
MVHLVQWMLHQIEKIRLVLKSCLGEAQGTNYRKGREQLRHGGRG